MEKKAAIALRDYVLEAKEVFDRVINSDPQSLGDLSQEKAMYNEDAYNKIYGEFEEELRLNMRKYKDKDIIFAYLKRIFDIPNPWEGIRSKLNERILQVDFENTFLFELKVFIEEGFCRFYWLTKKSTFVYTNLGNFFDQLLVDKISEPKFDARFDFDKLLADSNQLTTLTDKIQSVIDRKTELLQWQLKYDELEDYTDFNVRRQRYKYSNKLYPNFEKLCDTEIKRLQKQIEIEKIALTMQAIERNPVTIETRGQMPMYKWNSSDTDFLELFTALYHSKSIVCFSGELPTRKEMLEYFQQIFNIEIKDVEGKLYKAGNRNRNTQFIDNLSQQFRNYVSEKESKSMSR